jgi:hypothetical protein
VAAVLGLLFCFHPATLLSAFTEQSAAHQGTNAVALWLASPQTPPASDHWALTIDAHQAGWLTRSFAVRERLVALQAQQQIVGFAALSGDVGFVITACEELPPEVRSWPEIARITAPEEATPEALAAWWRQGLASMSFQVQAQQAVTLSLNLGLDSYLVSGRAPRPESIDLTLVLSDVVIASGSADPFPDGMGGYSYVAHLWPVYYGGGGGFCGWDVLSGGVLEAVQAGRIVSLTVPPLSVLAEQDSGVVSGETAPSATLDIYLYRYADPDSTAQQTVSATPDGSYQASFGTLAPRDHGYVFYIDASGNGVYAAFHVPWLRIGVGHQYAGGVAMPNQPLVVTLVDAGGNLLDQYHSCTWSTGAFGAYLYPEPQAGHTVVVTAGEQTISMTVPALTAHPSPAQDAVSGETLAGMAVEVDLYVGPLGYESGDTWPTGSPAHVVTTTATVGGLYTASLAGLTDLAPPNYGVVYLTDASGYQAYRRFAVPFLRVHVGGYWLIGQVNGRQQVTVTVWSGSGIPRAMDAFATYDNGYFDRGWLHDLSVLPGDWVTLTQENGQEMGISVPYLTAQADLPGNTVYGKAPPHSQIRVALERHGYPSYPAPTPTPSSPFASGGGTDWQEYAVWVTSTATGAYTASLNNVVTMEVGDLGTAAWVSAQGHQAYVLWYVPGEVTLRLQRGGNHVSGVYRSNLDWDYPTLTITLRDAMGQVKAQDQTRLRYNSWFEVHLYGQDGWPALIQAGDTVEAIVRDQSVALSVPPLTVDANAAGNVIYGQAPPDAQIDVSWRGADGWDAPSRSWTITATASSAYELDLSGEVDVERGDRLEASWVHPDGHTVWTARQLPRIEAMLGERRVTVLGVPYPEAPVTVTLRAADGSLIETASTFAKGGHSAAFYLQSTLGEGQRLAAQLPGEEVTLTLPRLTSKVDIYADVVQGVAPPNASLQVAVSNSHYWYWPAKPTASQGKVGAEGGGWWSSWQPVTATVTGTYYVDFSGQSDISAGTKGTLAYLDPDGHRVFLTFGAPYLEVWLGRTYVKGWSAGPGTVTTTLQHADGTFKGQGMATADSYSGRFQPYLYDDAANPVSVQSGDRLIVETGDTVMTVTVPTLSASFDRPGGILSGSAPPGAWLRASLDDMYREVLVSPDGHYALDWSDQDVVAGMGGAVRYVDSVGNVVWIEFMVPWERIYLPLILR